MKGTKLWLIYLAVALLLGGYWVLSLWSQDYTHALYFNPRLQSLLYALPILAGAVLGCCMKAPESRLWALLDGVLALLLLPVIFAFLTVLYTGLGTFGQIALNCPVSVRSVLAILCGILLGQILQILRPHK